MVSNIVIGMLFLLVFTQFGLGLSTQLKATQSIYVAQSEKTAIESMKMVLSKSFGPYGKNNSLVAPIDFNSTVNIDGKDYLTIPESLGIPSTNKWGNPYIYCPISGDNKGISDASTATEINSGDSSYFVNVFDDNIPNNIDYVLESDLTLDQKLYDEGLILAVISPIKDSQTPSCSNLGLIDGEAHVISDQNNSFSALVTSFSRTKLENNYTNTFYEVETRNFPELTLDQVVSSWHSTQPRKYAVTANDNINISEDLNFNNKNPLDEKVISINSDSDNQVIISSLDKKRIEFHNIDVNIRNVAFDNVDLVFINSKVELENFISTGRISLTSSEIKVKGDAIISSDSNNPSLKLVDSKLNLLNSNASFFNIGTGKGIQSVSSVISVINGNLSSSSTGSDTNPIISLNTGSSFNLSNAKFNAIAPLITSSVKTGVEIDESSSMKSSMGSTVIIEGEYQDFFLNRGNLSFSNSFIDVKANTKNFLTSVLGNTSIDNSTMYLTENSSKINNLAILESGSSLHLGNSIIADGSKGIENGVRDKGAKFISGNNTSIFSNNNCWVGYLFSSPVNANESTATNTSIQKSANKSSWSCL